MDEMNSTYQNRVFCHDHLWDINKTWYSDNPDFTLCFHSTALVYIPSGYAFAFLPFYIWIYFSGKMKNDFVVMKITWIRISLVALMTIANLLALHKTWNPITPTSEIISLVLSTATNTVLIFVLYIKAKKLRQSTSCIYTFFFWLLSILCSSLTVCSVARFPNLRTHLDNWCVAPTFVFKLISFLLEFVPDKRSSQICSEKGMTSPEIGSSFPSRLVFGWIDGLLVKGWRTPLGYENLFDLKQEDTVSIINQTWENHYGQNNGRRGGILRPLILAFGGLFLQTTICRLVYTIVYGVCEL